MEINTLVPGIGFCVPKQEIIGKGNELYCAFAEDPDGEGNDYMFLIAAESETKAQKLADKHAEEFFNENNDEGNEWEADEDFTVFLKFIGNKI